MLTTLSVLAIVPLMQIHLFESTSSKPMTRQMAKHNLALCMLAMEELSKSYLSAVAAYKLFEMAIQKVEKAHGGAPQEALGGVLPSLPPTIATSRTDESRSASWENWPESYSTSTASVITDVWLPWTNGSGTQ